MPGQVQLPAAWQLALPKPGQALQPECEFGRRDRSVARWHRRRGQGRARRGGGLGGLFSRDYPGTGVGRQLPGMQKVRGVLGGGEEAGELGTFGEFTDPPIDLVEFLAEFLPGGPVGGGEDRGEFFERDSLRARGEAGGNFAGRERLAVRPRLLDLPRQRGVDAREPLAEEKAGLPPLEPMQFPLLVPLAVRFAIAVKSDAVVRRVDDGDMHQRVGPGGLGGAVGVVGPAEEIAPGHPVPRLQFAKHDRVEELPDRRVEPQHSTATLLVIRQRDPHLEGLLGPVAGDRAGADRRRPAIQQQPPPLNTGPVQQFAMMLPHAVAGVLFETPARLGTWKRRPVRGRRCGLVG